MNFPAGPAALLLAFACGCTTVRHSSIYNGVKIENGETPIATVEIENTGWRLLDFMPIASGDPDLPNANTCRWFENTVTLQNNLNVLMKEMTAMRATRIANLTSHKTKESILFILLSRHACHTSAILVGPATRPLEKEPDK